MESYTWDEIYGAMGESLGVRPRLVHVPVGRLVARNRKWVGPLLGDKAWSVLFDNSKVMSVAGEFRCEVSLLEGMKTAAADYHARREAAYRFDEHTHALLDRIAEAHGR
jgi:hypothetical protein